MQNTFSQFSPDSKVWIYQSSRAFTDAEIEWLDEQLLLFTRQWTAHNEQLTATGKVLEDRFIMLMVDETNAYASGCSVDKSVHFIKSLERALQAELFDRMLVNYKDAEAIQTAHLSDLAKLLQEGIISDSTMIYDPLVQTKKEFDEHFLLPLSGSWVKQFV